MSTRATPCASCKYTRRRCTAGCVFAVHFPAENQQRFACVHHVIGTANVGNMLKQLTEESDREGAMKTVVYQTEARVRDPINGCMGFITEMEEKFHKLQKELDKGKKELLEYMTPEVMQILLDNPQMTLPPPSLLTPLSNLNSLYHDSTVNFAPPILVGPTDGHLVFHEPPPPDRFQFNAAKQNQQQPQPSQSNHAGAVATAVPFSSIK
ncbi:hypothetical protein VNO77_25332 [Canavalia gladiata]|uniref:LOB domain-containing protein n=1 Tax=Canavalia gladiata TaxID=3824 RepID=A0AAN9LD35_CANGL